MRTELHPMASVRRTFAHVFGLLFLLNLVTFVGLNYWNLSQNQVALEFSGYDNSTIDNSSCESCVHKTAPPPVNLSDATIFTRAASVNNNLTNTTSVLLPLRTKGQDIRYSENNTGKNIIIQKLDSEQEVMTVTDKTKYENDSAVGGNLIKPLVTLNYNSIKNASVDRFSYILNPHDICKGDEFLVTIVTTIHSHIDQRHAIRETWKSVKSVDGMKVVTLFLLGKGTKLESWKALVEYRKFHDMVSFDFEEHYLNLTLKTLMGLKWVREHCPHAAYILKTDDDVFVNHLSLVRNLTHSPRNGFAIGYVWYSAAVNRNTKSKWYTPPDVYSYSNYPSYLAGTGYVISKDVADGVVRLAPTVPYLNWEDVYVGICMKRLGVKIKHDERFDHFGWYHRQTRKYKCPVHYIFTIHSLSVKMLKNTWGRYLAENKQISCINLYPRA